MNPLISLIEDLTPAERLDLKRISIRVSGPDRCRCPECRIGLPAVVWRPGDRWSVSWCYPSRVECPRPHNLWIDFTTRMGPIESQTPYIVGYIDVKDREQLKRWADELEASGIVGGLWRSWPVAGRYRIRPWRVTDDWLGKLDGTAP